MVPLLFSFHRPLTVRALGTTPARQSDVALRLPAAMNPSSPVCGEVACRISREARFPSPAAIHSHLGQLSTASTSSPTSMPERKQVTFQTRSVIVALPGEPSFANQSLEQPFLSGSNHNESYAFILNGFGGPAAIGTPLDIAFNNLFRCGDRDASKARVIHNIPNWRYHLALTPPGNNTGAIHTTDLAYVFNTTPYLVQQHLGVPFVPGLIPVIQGAWGAFAHDPVNGLTKYGWPRYDASGKFSLFSLRVLRTHRLEPISQAQASFPSRADAWHRQYSCSTGLQRGSEARLYRIR
jgi:hypothetical protein